MKRYYVICFIVFALSCQVSTKSPNYESDIEIINLDRSIITGLSDPKMSYTLLKDDEEYITVTEEALISNEESYSFTLNLLSGANYRFSEFIIFSGDDVYYILDEESITTQEGFTISIDGIFSTTPTVSLKKVFGMEYESLDYAVFSVDIVTDETELIDSPELTFTVSSNIPEASFLIYKYTIYWVTGPTLNHHEIFDMDTGEIFDPLEEGDDDPWGSGKYKIVTTNSSGESVFVIGFAEEWNKKHIYLNLD